MENTNNENQQPNVNSWANIDLEGWGILFAMFLKVFGLVPIVVRIAQTKSAEDISLATPIMFLVAFLILALISFKKAFYVPLGLFIIGIGVAVVLIVQKVLYEKSKSNAEEEINKEIQMQQTNFKFPNPNIPNLEEPIYGEFN